MTDTPKEAQDALFAARKQWGAATENGLDTDAALQTALEWMPLMFYTIEKQRGVQKELDEAKTLIQAMEIERGQMARAMERLGRHNEIERGQMARAMGRLGQNKENHE